MCGSGLALLLLLGRQRQEHCIMVLSVRLSVQGQCDTGVIEQQRHHGVDRHWIVAFASIALRGKAFQQALSCVWEATHRRIGCACGRLLRSAATVAVGESSTTEDFARLATYDRTSRRRGHLHSLLAIRATCGGSMSGDPESSLKRFITLCDLYCRGGF